MANESHPTPSQRKSKTQTTASDNRKPYPEFPLTAHPTGRWCKKIKGKLWYFGSIKDGWEAALQTYRDQIDDIKAGRTPTVRKSADGLTLQELCNKFMHHKRGLVDEGSLTLHSWYDYHRTCEKLLKVLGKQRLAEELTPDDFESLRRDFGAGGWGPVKIGNEVNRTRMIFKLGIEQGWIRKPILFGRFKRTDQKTLRKHRAKQRAEHGLRMFTAEELRRIVDAAPQPLKSMTMLGINGGLNNMDVATLYMGALDLERGILDFPRGKTGVPRIIPLWAETVAAIKEWLAVRPEPKHEEDGQLVFLTRQRRPWYRLGRFVDDGKGGAIVKGIDNPVAKSFRVLLDGLGLNGRRNFLALRHTFRTIGRGAQDREAIDSLMGHVDASMAGHYIEDGLPLERLRKVTDFIRAWLFADQPADGADAAPELLPFRAAK